MSKSDSKYIKIDINIYHLCRKKSNKKTNIYHTSGAKPAPPNQARVEFLFSNLCLDLTSKRKEENKSLHCPGINICITPPRLTPPPAVDISQESDNFNQDIS